LQLSADGVDAVLQALQLQRQGYYVFAPGAEYGPAKRWPAPHFAALARQLTLPVVLLGSNKEADLCAEIAQAVNAAQPGQCLDWSGRTTLDQALAAIAGASAMVSNDSGLMHVAAALGVPQVAIFGSSSPLHTPPLSDRAQVVWLKNDPATSPRWTVPPVLSASARWATPVACRILRLPVCYRFYSCIRLLRACGNGLFGHQISGGQVLL
jgi:heptosyltransferase-2